MAMIIDVGFNAITSFKAMNRRTKTRNLLESSTGHTLRNLTFVPDRSP